VSIVSDHGVPFRADLDGSSAIGRFVPTLDFAETPQQEREATRSFIIDISRHRIPRALRKSHALQVNNLGTRVQSCGANKQKNDENDAVH
jgi:hypothetical protein